MKFVRAMMFCLVQVRGFCVLLLFVVGLLAINQSAMADAPDELTESFWQEIEAAALPEGYQGATHQEFVDAQMAKLADLQRARVGQLWKKREKSSPPMTNRGASFVKIMMFVAEGEADLTDRFINKEQFEKYFLPWNVNLTLDHEEYLSDRPQIQQILTMANAPGNVARSVDSWTGWLGPNRNGWVADIEPPTAWPKSLSKEWSVEVGTGYGSPLVVEDRLYQHARQGEEEVV